jgi:hypothetical protein
VDNGPGPKSYRIAFTIVTIRAGFPSCYDLKTYSPKAGIHALENCSFLKFLFSFLKKSEKVFTTFKKSSSGNSSTNKDITEEISLKCFLEYVILFPLFVFNNINLSSTPDKFKVTHRV